MTTTVPANDNSAALKIQTQIAALSSKTDGASSNQVEALQKNLVSTLMQQGALSPATILSTVSYAAPANNLLGAQITKLNALITAQAASPNLPRLLAELAAVQARYVEDLMANPRSGLTAGAILSNASLSYQGHATNTGVGGG